MTPEQSREQAAEMINRGADLLEANEWGTGAMRRMRGLAVPQYCTAGALRYANQGLWTSRVRRLAWQTLVDVLWEDVPKQCRVEELAFTNSSVEKVIRWNDSHHYAKNKQQVLDKMRKAAKHLIIPQL